MWMKKRMRVVKLKNQNDILNGEIKQTGIIKQKEVIRIEERYNDE